MSEVASLKQLFEASVGHHGARVFVHEKGRDFTYEQIGARARSLAAALATAGVRRGDRVLLVLPNSASYVASYIAVLAAGGCVVACDPESVPRELTWVAGHSEARAAIMTEAAAERLAAAGARLPGLTLLIDGAVPASLRGQATPLADAESGRRNDWPDVPVGSGDLAQLIYTSGTTGKPKGVTLTHGNLVANTRSILGYLHLGSQDAIFVILPFFYSYGNSLLLTHAAVGGRLVLASQVVFWNAVLDEMKQQAVTGFSGVPSTYSMLLQRSVLGRDPMPALRYLTCAGGGLPPPLVQELRRRLPGIQLYLMYGQTEASARLTSLLPEEVESHLGSCGRAIPGVEITIRDRDGRELPPGEVGEIVARGDNIMRGYWREPDLTAEVLRPEGLYTGDLASRDADGFIWIVGRSSDMIKSGGYRLSPAEIESALLELEGVAEVAVVGRPDPLLGEVPVAFVVPAARAQLTAEAVMRHARTALARSKQPREVRLVASLPKTASGKIRRTELRAQLAG